MRPFMLVFLLLLAPAAALATAPPLIPLPVSAQSQDGTFRITGATRVDGRGEAAATADYLARELKLRRGDGPGSRILFRIVPRLGGDEAYRLSVTASEIRVEAARPASGFTEILADKQVDAQIGYTFPETHRLGNLGVLLQVNNLTDSPYRTTIGVDGSGPVTANGGRFIETYEKYGRQWLLGFNYRF